MSTKTENNESLIWMLYELEEAKEHLESLLTELSENEVITEEEFKVYMGHIYAHLNRAWNSRNRETEVREENWEEMRKFPTDIEPIG